MLKHYFPGARRLIIKPCAEIVPEEENVPIPSPEQQQQQQVSPSIYSSKIPSIEDLPELSRHSPASANRDSLLSSTDSGNESLPLPSLRSPASIFAMSNPSIVGIADQAMEEPLQLWTGDEVHIVTPDFVRREEVKPRMSSLSKSWMRPKSETRRPKTHDGSIAELLPHDFCPAKKEHKMSRLWKRWK